MWKIISLLLLPAVANAHWWKIEPTIDVSPFFATIEWQNTAQRTVRCTGKFYIQGEFSTKIVEIDEFVGHYNRFQRHFNLPDFNVVKGTSEIYCHGYKR